MVLLKYIFRYVLIFIILVLLTANIHAQQNRVLTQDIVITAHTPIGTTTAPFTDNFYGNGHTITIRGFATGVTSNFGYFGVVGDGAVIRDLTVVYETVTGGAVTISTNAAANFGGIAGTTIVETTQSNAQFINVLVKGSVTITKTTSGNLLAGGMIGNMSNAATIQNAYSGINITVTKTGTGDVYFGGIVGDTATGGTSTRIAIDGVTVTGNLTLTQDSGVMYFGGGTGRSQAAVTFNDIEFTGTLTPVKTGGGANRIGGIAGQVTNSTYTLCKSTGSINMPGTFAGTGTTHIGGLVGSFTGNSVMEDSFASGNLNIRSSTTNNSAQMLIGGIVGYISGTSDTARAVIRRCSYRSGDITFTYTGTDHGQIYVGGAIGGSYRFGDIESCWSAARSVNYTSAVSTETSGIGGFVGGQFNTDIAECYAVAQVNVDAVSAHVGGFTGYLRSQDLPGVGTIPARLFRCYASGAVNANVGNVGGLVGYAFGVSTANALISNCYATGNVLSTRTGTVYVGGLVGYCSLADVEYSFAKGTVTGQSSTSVVSAGGITGYLINSTVKNCIALGDSVTARTNGTKYVGRIYGNTASGNENNYANAALLVLETTANDYFTLGIPSTETDASSRNGRTTAPDSFGVSSFWQSTLGFNTTIWNFINVLNRRHPQLAWE